MTSPKQPQTDGKETKHCKLSTTGTISNQSNRYLAEDILFFI
jgi:hypothetical protein